MEVNIFTKKKKISNHLVQFLKTFANPQHYKYFDLILRTFVLSLAPRNVEYQNKHLTTFFSCIRSL